MNPFVRLICSCKIDEPFFLSPHLFLCAANTECDVQVDPDLADLDVEEECEPAGDKCCYIQIVEDCDDIEGLIDFVYWHFCQMDAYGLAGLGIFVLVRDV